MTWWQEWKLLGILPEPGTLAEQPAYVVDVIRICEEEMRGIDASSQRQSADELRRAMVRR